MTRTRCSALELRKPFTRNDEKASDAPLAARPCLLRFSAGTLIASTRSPCAPLHALRPG